MHQNKNYPGITLESTPLTPAKILGGSVRNLAGKWVEFAQYLNENHDFRKFREVIRKELRNFGKWWSYENIPEFLPKALM